MSETKFSPGPWVQSLPAPGFRFADTGDRIVQASDGFVVAMVIHDRPPNAEPNAHLIAAAPELYEALEQAKSYIHALPIQNSKSFTSIMKVINGSLEKARGES